MLRRPPVGTSCTSRRTPRSSFWSSLGYTYVAPEDLDVERASSKETIFTGRLADAVKRLNPWLSETNVASAVKAVTQVPVASLAEANRKIGAVRSGRSDLATNRRLLDEAVIQDSHVAGTDGHR